MSEKILELATTLSGAGATELDLLEMLCTVAEAFWRSRLRDDVTATECSDALCCAAAFTAAADLATGRRGGVESFTAGDISVKTRGGVENAALAASLRQTAERLMVPYAKTADFCFRGVQG